MIITAYLVETNAGRFILYHNPETNEWFDEQPNCCGFVDNVYLDTKYDAHKTIFSVVPSLIHAFSVREWDSDYFSVLNTEHYIPGYHGMGMWDVWDFESNNDFIMCFIGNYDI